MDFFLDTGNLAEIKEAVSWGIVDGVTTNPSIVAQTGRRREDIVVDICHLVDGPVSAEVIATESEEMINEAKELSQLHSNIVVKLPLTLDGIKACKWCSGNNIKTNVTLCFSLAQALVAAKVGASYISPFVGRIDDMGENGLHLIDSIRTAYDNYGFKTKILAASLRTTSHVGAVSIIGADVATMPFAIMKKLFEHPLTNIGLQKFLADYKRTHEKP